MVNPDSPLDQTQPIPNVVNSGSMSSSMPSGSSVVMQLVALIAVCVLGFGIYKYTKGGTAAQAPQRNVAAAVAPSAASSSAATGGSRGPATAAVGGALKTVAHDIKQMANTAPGGLNAQMQIDAVKQQAASQAGTATAPGAVATAPVIVPGSVTDIIGSRVSDETGRAAGTVYDILVDRQSGNTRSVIVNDGQAYHGLDLKAVRFTEVSGQNADGAFQITANAADVNASQPFAYTQVPADSFISLRALEGGQVLDDQGKSAGKIDAITYRDGSAQNIVFTIPAPDTAHRAVNFYLPYRAVKIITTPGGQHYIQLDHAQMEVMARAVFQPQGR